MKPLFGLLLAWCFVSATAQNITNSDLKQQMIKNWERAKAYTLEYLNAMPADKYGYRPTDSMRNFAQQMLHLATGNGGLGSIGTGQKFPFRSFDIEKSISAQSKDSVIWFVTASYDFVINGIKNLDPIKLGEPVTFNLGSGNTTEPRYVWIAKTFEHQTHHRGQCTVYIRLVGIKPPQEQLF